jgi:single-strand DNA-binding protein
MAARAAPARAPEAHETTNEVRLLGRLSVDPVERVLPSGDRVVTLRVVVPRPAPRRSPQAPTVDVVDVGCWSAATRRSALRLRAGDEVEVSGSLRRRFFRTGAGVQSRYEVEAGVVRKRAP